MVFHNWYNDALWEYFGINAILFDFVFARVQSNWDIFSYRGAFGQLHIDVLEESYFGAKIKKSDE